MGIELKFQLGEPQGRAIGGYSLRKSLENQGVTTEEAMREHLGFVYILLSRGVPLDITQYRVNQAQGLL